jgi:hypothetical protein
MNIGVDPDLGRDRPGILAIPEPEAAGDQSIDLLEGISSSFFGTNR